MNNDELLQDLKFIKDTLSELIVDIESYDFGPGYELAKSRKQLAIVKLNRIIR